MIFIIGSGLSAIAAAVALVERGNRPTILDAGLTPDSDARELKERLAATEPEFWQAADVSSLKRTGPVAANGIPRKLHFGSDFTFQKIQDATPLDLQHASVSRSFAAGGFSNVWGAVLEPLKPREMQDWPLGLAELTPHYAAVHALMRDVSGSTHSAFSVEGSLSEIQPSSQARALYRDLAVARKKLSRQGIRFGFPKLAIRSVDRDGLKGCRYCGMCLYGCPYDSIYTADSTLSRLVREGRVRYVSGVVVDKLSRTNGHIIIQGRSLKDGSDQIFQGRRVFVAAGLLETTRIMLTSLGLFNTPLQIKHSDIFTLPLIRYSAVNNVLHERLYTLSQIVAEVDDSTLCAYPVRLQFYGYNDLYRELLARRLGRLAPLSEPALRALEARLFVVFGYLHSSVSSSLTISLTRGRESKLRVEGLPNPLAGQIGRAVARKLLQNRKYFQAIPLRSQLRMDLPGGGYHSGGSFPMRNEPGHLETDRWGCLPALPGVHLIDASVLPAVPASPVSFTVMANAHRIASACAVPHDE